MKRSLTPRDTEQRRQRLYRSRENRSWFQCRQTDELTDALLDLEDATVALEWAQRCHEAAMLAAADRGAVSRQLAQITGLSHVTVNKRLAALGEARLAAEV